MKQKRVIPLRTRLILIFFTAMLLMAVIYYFMNIYFWKKYYISSNESALRETYTSISALLSDGSAGLSELEQAMTEAKLDRNISIAIQGASDWDFRSATVNLISPYDRKFLLERLQEDFISSSPEGVEVIEKNADYTLQRVTVSGDGGRYLEMYGYMEDSEGERKKFIFSLPLENIFYGYSVSNLFFLYFSFGIILLGSLAIAIISKRISEPIRELSGISRRMKNLDFSARYTGDLNDEIGMLGNNMNELASQLERSFLQLELANEQLKKDIQEKEEVDEMRKDFISNVSHELKTPIALIRGYAEGLKEIDPSDRESVSYYVDVISDEADKMNRMVRKLTTLNQLEFGHEEPEYSDFDIMEMIRDLSEGVRKMESDHPVNVIDEGPESLLVHADPYKIGEVLNNYLSNALNHLAEPYEIRITADDLGPSVRVSVRNTGVQIPEDELDKIWIKFHKVDKARTRAYGGSGLGLSIVKAIMDAHGTAYGVYNVEDGVVFWFEVKKGTEEEDGSDHGPVGAEAGA